MDLWLSVLVFTLKDFSCVHMPECNSLLCANKVLKYVIQIFVLLSFDWCVEHVNFLLIIQIKLWLKFVCNHTECERSSYFILITRF